MPRTILRTLPIAALLAAGIFGAPRAGAAEIRPATPQPAASTSLAATGDIHALLNQVRQLVARQQQQQQQIEQQQQQIDELRSQLHLAHSAATTPAQVSSTSNPAAALREDAANFIQPSALRSAPVAARTVAPQTSQSLDNQNIFTQAETPGPLFLKIGSATFTPGGWIDITSINRSTAVGSGFTTALAALPLNNSVAGGLTESRLTAQNSRFSLRIDENIKNIRAYGYAEVDFNGYQPGNAYVSTNSDSIRLRAFYLDLSRGKWDLLGGQDWSLLTPNRAGLGPFLADIYNTVHLDTAYNDGIVYARQAQVRAVYHFSPGVAFGLSAENSQQFSGSAVTFPALFSNTETDINSSSGSGGATATPNRYPDVIAKLALDHKFDQHNWHLELSGLATPFVVTTPASVTKSGSRINDSREGGGVSVNGNFELHHGLHLIADSYWSDGGSRYIGGLGPGFVVSQNGSVTAPFNVQTVHSGAGLGGFEWQATKKTLYSFVYGGAYFSRVSSLDPDTGTLVGYGYRPLTINSSTTATALTQNRFIQEASFSTVSTLWKNTSHGAVQTVTQTSYAVRTPWFVPAGSPKNAHVFMEWLDLRYVLP